MDKILDNHNCDLLIIRCMDFRFQGCVKELMSKEGVSSADEISMAGGAKAVIDNRECVLKMIDIFKNSHHGKKIAILSHRDCGAYGGSKNFASPAEEKLKLLEDLDLAKSTIKESFGDIEINTYFLDSDTDKATFELV